MFRNQGGSDWKAKAVGFLAASTIAGTVTGLALGFFGSLWPPTLRIALAGLAASGGLLVTTIDLMWRPIALPQCNSETPQRWVNEGPLGWSIRNGLALGCGAFSRVGFLIWYVIPGAALLFGSPAAGAALYGSYAFIRGAAPLVLISAGVALRRTRGTFDDLARGLLRHYSLARRASSLVLIGILSAAVMRIAL